MLGIYFLSWDLVTASDHQWCASYSHDDGPIRYYGSDAYVIDISWEYYGSTAYTLHSTHDHQQQAISSKRSRPAKPCSENKTSEFSVVAMSPRQILRILTMTCKTWGYWILNFVQHPVFKEQNFFALGLHPISGERVIGSYSIRSVRKRCNDSG
jgi:hypothetical protein